MPSDITIVIADPARMSAIRGGLTLSGRTIWFPTNKLASAWESIQLNHPKLIAVDAVFAETPQGTTFIERVERLTIRGSAIRLIVRGNGSWMTTPRGALGSDGGERLVVPSAVIVPPALNTNTRRAHRFRVLDPLKAMVEGGQAVVVNMSILGAQVTSEPLLRPTQKVKVALPDSDDLLHLTAHVAWSKLEQAEQRTGAYCRAGIEFTDAASQTLEDYCRRHCAEQPLPSY
jgi:hypothetical protein